MKSSEPTDKAARLTWKWNGKQYTLPINRDDVIMLARAVEEEGYPEEGVAWALIQRAAWLNMQGNNVRLGKLVEQYAQPINPAWFPGGPKHKEEIARLERLGDRQGVLDEQARAIRRRAKAAKQWHEMSEKTRTIIGKILLNQLPNPVQGAVHYWASRAPDFAGNQARKPNLVLLDRGFGFGKGRNVFFAAKGSEAFQGIRVHGVALGFGFAGLLVAGLVGMAVWKGFV